MDGQEPRAPAGAATEAAAEGDSLAGPRKTRIGEANAVRILDAALTVFSAYGYHGARVEQIAAAAGMSKPNLLYYFRSKDALYTAVLERTLDMWLEPLRGLDASRDPFDALGEYIANKLEASRRDPAASRMFAMEIIQGAPHLSPVLSGRLKCLVDAKAAIIERWIAEGRMAPVDPRHLLFSIWATTQHYADFAVQVRAVAGSDLSDDDFHRRTLASLTTILLGGLRP
jgi:TetR/AcrR family transcriptional regulator